MLALSIYAIDWNNKEWLDLDEKLSVNSVCLLSRQIDKAM